MKKTYKNKKQTKKVNYDVRLVESIISDIDFNELESNDDYIPVDFNLDIHLTHANISRMSSFAANGKQQFKENFEEEWPNIINSVRDILDNSILFEDEDEPQYEIEVFCSNKHDVAKAPRSMGKTEQKTYDGPVDDVEEKFNLFFNKEICIIRIIGKTNIYYQNSTERTRKSVERTVRSIVTEFSNLGLPSLRYTFELLYMPDEVAMKLSPVDYASQNVYVVPISKINRMKFYSTSSVDASYDVNSKSVVDVNSRMIDIEATTQSLPQNFMNLETILPNVIKSSESNINSQVTARVGLFRITDNCVEIKQNRFYSANIEYIPENELNMCIRCHASIYRNFRMKQAFKQILFNMQDYINEHAGEIEYKCMYKVYDEVKNLTCTYLLFAVMTNIIVKVDDCLFVLGMYVTPFGALQSKQITDFQKQSIGAVCSLAERFTGTDEFQQEFEKQYKIDLSKCIDSAIVNLP